MEGLVKFGACERAAYIRTIEGKSLERTQVGHEDVWEVDDVVVVRLSQY